MESYNNSYLLDRRVSPGYGNGIIKYNEVYKNKIDNYLCFVEGTSDVCFYSNLSNYRFLSENNCDYIDNMDCDFVGKDKVIQQFNFVKRNNPSDLEKCIFIVDHDFDGVLSSKLYVSESDKERFSVTKPYAFENYFLTTENIEKIFKYFGISDDDRYVFEKKLDQFVEEIGEYVRLKSTTTAVCKKGSKYKCYIGPSSIYKSRDIFDFNFKNDDDFYFDKDLLGEEIKSMDFAIKNADSMKALVYYYSVAPNFVNKREFVRGHDIYNFLEKYLLQNFNKNIHQDRNNKKYIDIIHLLDVDMEFRNGFGYLIKE